MNSNFMFYALRWQLSTPILYLATVSISGIWGTIIGNFIGACIFYFVDKWIFNNKIDNKKDEKK